MHVLQVNVIGHQLQLPYDSPLASGNQLFDTVYFAFDGDWDGFQCIALFWKEDAEQPYASTVVDGYATVPWEVMTEKNKIKFGVYGTKLVGNETVRAASVTVTYNIKDGAYSEDAINTGTPTPTLVDQILANISAFEESVDQRVSDLEVSFTDDDNGNVEIHIGSN